MLKLSQLIISLMIFVFLITFMIYKIISKFHLFHIIMIFMSFYYYSHSDVFHDHGAFNMIGFLVVLFLFLLCFL